MSMHMNSICRGTSRSLRRKRWRVLQCSFSVPEAHILSKTVRTWQLLNCRRGFSSRALEVSCPLSLAEGLQCWGQSIHIRTTERPSVTSSYDSSWLCSKDHASLSPVLSIIFFKSVSDISFLGCSHKREFCRWHGVRGLIGIPGTVCVCPQEQVEAGKAIHDRGGAGPDSLEGN